MTWESSIQPDPSLTYTIVIKEEVENIRYVNPARFAELMDTAFSGEDLHSLILKLGFQTENIPGNTKKNRIEFLIITCTRRGRLQELWEFCGRERPRTDWHEALEPEVPQGMTASLINEPHPNNSTKQKQQERPLWVQMGITTLLIVGATVWFIRDPNVEPILVVLASVITLAADIFNQKWVKWIIFGGVALSIIAFIALTVGSGKSIVITIRVADLNDRPVVGATVLLFADDMFTSDVTDSNGVASLVVDSAQNAEIIVQQQGYEVNRQELFIRDPRLLPVVLQEATGGERTVIARVINANSNQSLAGAQVTIIHNGMPFENVTDANGLASFTLPFEDNTASVDITVRYEDLELNKNVTLRSDQVQDLLINPTTDALTVQNITIPGSAAASSGDCEGTELVSGQPVTGSIDSLTEIDVFCFTAVAGELILLRMAATSEEFCPVIELRDPAGESLATERTYPGCNNTVLEVRLPETNTYTILVQSDSFAEGTGTYEIFLQTP